MGKDKAERERQKKQAKKKDGVKGEKNVEYTQIQGTRTNNHGNQALNFNPSCSRYYGNLSIRNPRPILWPFSEALDLTS